MRRFLLLLATALVASLIAAPVAGAQTEDSEGDFTLASVDSDEVTDRVGLVDPTTGIWHLRGAGGAVNSFFYGNPGDFPMAGDWDCDGISTPGLYRQSDGFVYLRNSNSEGVADIRFFFGNPGDIPLAGDFNDDGCDTVSIYRASESRIYIINELGANDGGLGAADFSYIFGNPGDKPFVGDFNGDGVDTVGLHRESTGFVYFRNSHTQGVANAEFFFGDPGDRLVAGDWGVVDDVDTPAIFRPSLARFFFRYTNTQGNANEEIQMGSFPMLPVAGSWTVKLGLAGTLPKAIVDLPYSATLKPVGGTPPYTITKTGGPAWVSVTNSGTFSGTPPTVGTSNVGITVTDSKGLSINQLVPLTVQDGCDTNNQIPNNQCLALVALYKATGGRSWLNDTGWFTMPPCSWSGVTCNPARTAVTALVLEDNNLSGPISSVPWASLNTLTEVNLQHNLITGAMPASLANIPTLQVLDVSGNDLGPSVPNFSGPANLVELDFSDNSFAGSIAGIAAETSLQLLKLNNNNTLSGDLSALTGMVSLQDVDLSDNQFGPDVGTVFANKTALVSLNLSANSFSGLIPDSIANPDKQSMTELDLAVNQFTGEVPSSLLNLENSLTSLTLCGNNMLTITVPGGEALLAFVSGLDPEWNVACS